jgi:hypothetical protein
MKSITRNRILSSAAAFLFATSAMMGAQATASYDQLKAQHPGWMQIPGKLIRPDCVHQVPSGAQIEVGSDGQPTGDVKMNGTVIAHYESCPEESIDTRHISEGQQDPGTGNGWVEAAQWDVSLKSTDNIANLDGYFHVPNPPTAGGALVYLFNGLEPSSENWIMQPVLQWGDNGAFGGDYYVFASWLVGPNGSGIAFYSTPYNVTPGDYLLGINQQSGASGGSDLAYFVNSYDETTHQSSVLNLTTTNLHWVSAFAGVLEAYGVTSCSQFPPNDVSHFYKTQVAHNYPSFENIVPEGFYGATYNYGGPKCKFSVSVSGNGVKAGSTSALKY